SMGTPSFFVHSTEGAHGDLGMIQKEDIVILITNSGETKEVLNLLSSLKQIGTKTIAITSNSTSTIANECNIALIYNYDKEADHLGLAPTVSSTIVLVMGDAMAVTLSQDKSFNQKDFHLFHPGGSLGSQLKEKHQN